MAETTKFLLSEDAIPTHWVNLLPDLPGEPLPPLNPQTMAPAGPPDLTPIFPMELIGQEVSGEPEIEIPEQVREVFMVGSSYDQKPYRRSMMQTWGATVHRSPSSLTHSGRSNAEHPTGSLGIAISEAVEVAAQDPECNDALGSVLNHVLLKAGLIEAVAYRQDETFAAALDFARNEGIIPAPEPAHAIKAAIAAKEAGEERVILFGLCGHGHFDLAAYDAYLAGTLEDPEFSEADRDVALAALPAGAPSLA